MNEVEVVYRGPFQSRRIRLILDTIEHLGRPIHFVWMDPRTTAGEPPDFFVDFAESRPSLVRTTYLRGDLRSAPDALRALGRGRGARSDLVVAIGFTALVPARLLRPRQLVWCINGIPEERLLHDGGRRARLTVDGLWRSVQLGPRPDAVITVSKPMSALVNSRLGVEQVLELPTAVDRAVFRPQPKDDPPVLTYVGSGAPWQDLPLLGAVWREVARKHDDATFLVVSRDDRAKAAIEDVPSNRAELVAGYGPDHVAELTAGATMGFVIRRPHVVNEVSFPTKFGEYVASGTQVVTTDIGWDLADIVRETGCGLLIDWRSDPGDVAGQILEHLESHPPADRAAGCAAAAKLLDRDRWIADVGRDLTRALA